MPVRNLRFSGSAILAGALVLATAPASEAATTAGGYPNGCGLTVLLDSAPSGGWIFTSSLTSCPYLVDSIRMKAKIYRSRWYGWEQMQDGSVVGPVRRSEHFRLGYRCAGTGVYDYKIVTNGAVVVSGKEYTAAAYDILEKASC